MLGTKGIDKLLWHWGNNRRTGDDKLLLTRLLKNTFFPWLDVQQLVEVFGVTGD